MSKPSRIRILDFEMASKPPNGGLVEIGYWDIEATSFDLAGDPLGWVVAPAGWSAIVNPGCEIPPVESAIHNLTDEDVSGARDWRHVLETLMQKSRSDGISIFAAHSKDSELEWIAPELVDGATFLCTYRCALRLWQDSPTHSNGGLRYWRKPAGLQRDLAAPTHRARSDAYVTAHLLRDMLNDGTSIEQLTEWSNELPLTLRCFIGAWRRDGEGTPWKEVDDGMLQWILDKDFRPEVMHTARYHLALRRDAERAASERYELNRQLVANGLPPEPMPLGPYGEILSLGDLTHQGTLF